jgi:DNA-binding NtrC family response regulator
LENELFGHEKGAFTGAVNRKRGLIEHAQQGTIFLDEIGDVPFSVQSKLLRFLQEGEYRRVGGSTVFRSEARVLLATNRDLPEMVRQKRFREDLYYRIKGVQIYLPPLRDRRSDLPLLARDFLKTAALKADKRVLGFSPQALQLMNAYNWPGNIRELRNEIERIVALKDSEWIDCEDFDASIRKAGAAKLAEPDDGTLRNIEKQAIEKRLQELNWNFMKTARALGLTRQGLYNKVKSYNIRKN